ncbi:MAG TPA: Xaa-Pro peptidase family protein [Terriglobales bacterium]|nr:Xaa-Pro peptidase family protein [Terriglobales bacterium]
MLSRRGFVRLTTMAAATAVGSSAAPGENTPSLPPSLASLRSRRGEATPITTEERRQRIERARQLMGENRLDAILLTGGTSLAYFTGIRWWLSERLFAMVLPAKGHPFYVSPAFEEDRAREQIAAGPSGADIDVRTWEEDEDPYLRILQGLRDRGLATAHLGMEETVRYVFSDGLAKSAPTLDIRSATPVTAGCRMIKTANELALMKLANEVTLAAFAATYQVLHPGMTQRQVEWLITAAHSQLGFSGEAGVQLGEFSALPHGSAKAQVIRENQIVLIDGGCSVEGYQSDISRTFVLGKPSDKMKRNFEIVYRAQQAALAAAQPGAGCEAVDAAARKVIGDAGYGPGYKYFTHRLGHGIGMDGHEWPYLVRGNKLPLAVGMTFSDEPGIYLRGEFGVRLEDDMVITREGGRLMTPQSRSLEDPFPAA